MISIGLVTNVPSPNSPGTRSHAGRGSRSAVRGEQPGVHDRPSSTILAGIVPGEPVSGPTVAKPHQVQAGRHAQEQAHQRPGPGCPASAPSSARRRRPRRARRTTTRPKAPQASCSPLRPAAAVARRPGPGGMVRADVLGAPGRVRGGPPARLSTPGRRPRRVSPSARRRPARPERRHREDDEHQHQAHRVVDQHDAAAPSAGAVRRRGGGEQQREQARPEEPRPGRCRARRTAPRPPSCSRPRAHSSSAPAASPAARPAVGARSGAPPPQRGPSGSGPAGSSGASATGRPAAAALTPTTDAGQAQRGDGRQHPQRSAATATPPPRRTPAAPSRST